MANESMFVSFAIVLVVGFAAVLWPLLQLWLPSHVQQMGGSDCEAPANNLGPEHPPTKGAVWPKPKTQIEHQGYYLFDPDRFNFEIVDNNCTVLNQRIRHYIFQYHQLKNLSQKYRKNNVVKDKRAATVTEEANVNVTSDDVNLGIIKKLQVDLGQPCERYPHLEMDESYNLTVGAVANLTSSSLWGIIRGLETFSQLFYFTDDFTEIRVNAKEIWDAPAYKHRGLLVDTSRHFLPVKDLLTTLDAMAMNKMNVFHWHIVDDQSFPYQSEKFPDLSERGAYAKSMVYTKSDIQSIIEYATERGIRVLPEFDVPGHTRSWGVAYPNLLTQCYKHGKVVGLGPMDPTRNTTYKLIRDLFGEIQNVFVDHYMHVGGDEVHYDCWWSNPDIRLWMEENDLQSTSQLHSYFMSRTLPLLQPDSDAIVWQEVFNEGVELTKSTLVHVWQRNPGQHMYRALCHGLRVLYSPNWYLDFLTQTFEKMLQVDPRQVVVQSARGSLRDVDLDNVIGGEACMWGEKVDETNLHPRVWPRTSAVAERLWSGPGDSESKTTLRRIEEHACRMKRRGVPAAPPTAPGFCLS